MEYSISNCSRFHKFFLSGKVDLGVLILGSLMFLLCYTAKQLLNGGMLRPQQRCFSFSPVRVLPCKRARTKALFGFNFEEIAVSQRISIRPARVGGDSICR